MPGVYKLKLKLEVIHMNQQKAGGEGEGLNFVTQFNQLGPTPRGQNQRICKVL